MAWVLHLVLSLAVLGPPPAPEHRRYEVAWLTARGVSQRALTDALALRIPDLSVSPDTARPHEISPPYDYLVVRVEPRPGHDRVFELVVITSDGRGFFRDIETVGESPERVIATTLASLISAIERGDVEPDKTGVAVPESPNPPIRRPPPRVDPQPPPRWDVGFAMSGGAVLTVAPTGIGDVLGGFGGGLEVHARSPKGAFLGFGVRPIGRGGAGLGLVRVRLGLLAGYARRSGNFEMVLAGVLGVEPFGVYSDGKPASLRRGDEEPPALVLLGAAARFAPGLLIEPLGRRVRRLRIGPRIELGGSFVPDRGARVAGVVVRDGAGRTEAFRVGGFELAGAVELTLWFRG